MGGWVGRVRLVGRVGLVRQVGQVGGPVGLDGADGLVFT